MLIKLIVQLLNSSIATAKNNNVTNPLRIGTLTLGAWRFDGKIDEVSIYNQALTSYQIQHLYAEGLIRQILALR